MCGRDSLDGSGDMAMEKARGAAAHVSVKQKDNYSQQ